jgi:hypothetical protein
MNISLILSIINLILIVVVYLILKSNMKTTSSSSPAANKVVISSEATTQYPVFVSSKDQPDAKINQSFTYNPSTNTLSASNFTGNLTGNIVGGQKGSVLVQTSPNQTSFLSGSPNDVLVYDLSGNLQFIPQSQLTTGQVSILE